MLTSVTSRHRCLLFLLILLLFSVVSVAADSNYDEDAVRQVIDETKSLLKSKRAKIQEFAEVNERLGLALMEVQKCVQSNTEELEKVTRSLESLGDKVMGEAREVNQQRKNFLAVKSARQQAVTKCNVFVLQTEELLLAVGERQKKLLTVNMLSKRDDAIALIAAQPSNWREFVAKISPFLRQQSGLEGLSSFVIALGGVLVGGIFLLSLWLRKLLLAGLANHQQPMIRALVRGLTRYLYLLLPAFSLAVFARLLTSGQQKPIYLVALVATFCAYLMLRFLIRVFLKSAAGEEPLFVLPKPLAIAFERYLRWTALLLCCTVFFAEAEVFQKVDAPTFLLARMVMVTVLCLLCIRLSWLGAKFPGWQKSGKWLRLLLTPVFGAAMVTAWIGYYNLSGYILVSTLQTIVGLVLYFCAKYFLAATFRGLSYGRRGWSDRIRKEIGLKGEEVATSFFWLHFLLDIFCLALLLLSFVSIWSISEARFGQMLAVLIEGFTIGQITIAPGRIFLGLFFFFLFWTLSLWGKTIIRESLAGNSHLTPSTRDATVTISGYVGVVLAVLLAGGVAGMSFTSVTVIAGALSVGIGFGLQNIVNNFVSGLILIFERPIQRGDWIVVGPTEGYVAEISVRSTVIRTFDRAEVIVPNSELISGQVTNWMLSDRKGRVKIPVGVAYGSDTDLVKRLLLEVASAHPEVISTGANLEPQVLFMEFGESSLNFELRCFVQEIDKRLICRSDLNFAIDKVFREHQIVIPFPQRDVNVKGELGIGGSGCGALV